MAGRRVYTVKMTTSEWWPALRHDELGLVFDRQNFLSWFRIAALVEGPDTADGSCFCRLSISLMPHGKARTCAEGEHTKLHHSKTWRYAQFQFQPHGPRPLTGLRFSSSRIFQSVSNAKKKNCPNRCFEVAWIPVEAFNIQESRGLHPLKMHPK